MKSNIDFNTKDVDGFLSKTPPLKQINTSCKKIKLVQSLASNLPKLMLTNKIRPSIDELSKDSLEINFKKLNERELRLLNVQLSFIGHAYVYGGAKPLSTIPAVLAQPWVEISNLLGRPAVLSYASYCLDNWFKINEDEPVSLENVALIHNFLGGIDEDWFVTIHVCIENAAKNSINSAVQIANLFEKNLANKEHVHVNLKKLKESFIEINHILSSEKCLRSAILISITIV